MPAIRNGKFVIVGGASQVASYIGEQLLEGGAREVVLLDNLSLGSADSIRFLLKDPRCTFVRGDVLRSADLYDAFADADGVFAVAGIMGTQIDGNPRMGIDVNVTGFQNVLDACRYRHVKKIVISSSAAVHGSPQDTPTDEMSPMRWQSVPPSIMIYGASKVIGEALAQIYRQRYGLDYVALRYTGVYGERQHQRALMGGGIAAACAAIRDGKAPVIQGSPEQLQDYIFAGDVARANVMAMESAVSGESFLIAAGEAVSLGRAMEIVARTCGSRLAAEFRTPVGARMPATAAQQFNCDKARRMLGWEPQVSLEEGIARVARWVDQSAS